MVHTRATANNRRAITSNAQETTVKQTKAAARKAKKEQNAERERIEAFQKSCYVANRRREEASASAYIGQMKFIAISAFCITPKCHTYISQGIPNPLLLLNDSETRTGILIIECVAGIIT